MTAENLAVSANSEHSFESLPNVALSPHCGGGMGLGQVEQERVDYFMETIVGLQSGHPRRAVDIEQNY